MFAKITTRKSVRTGRNTGVGDPERTKRVKLMTTSEMLEQGLITKGDAVIIKDRPESQAIIEDYKSVIYQGNAISWNAWAKQITEWSAVNIYANVYSVKDGKSLDEIRSSYEYPVQDQTTESD